MTDSETAVLRKELRKALGKMEEQEKSITELVLVQACLNLPPICQIFLTRGVK